MIPGLRLFVSESALASFLGGYISSSDDSRESTS